MQHNFGTLHGRAPSYVGIPFSLVKRVGAIGPHENLFAALAQIRLSEIIGVAAGLPLGDMRLDDLELKTLTLRVSDRCFLGAEFELDLLQGICPWVPLGLSTFCRQAAR